MTSTAGSRIERAASGVDDVALLLVEDNPDDAEFALRALRKASGGTLNVLHLDDGVKALDYIFRSGDYRHRAGALPRVLLLDLKLPKVDGLEVLRRIKSDRATKAMPVVVLTSSREARDVGESYLLGANSYIVKPVEYQALIGTLGDVVRYWAQLNEPPRT